MIPNFLEGFVPKKFHDKDRAVHYDQFDLWTHIKCNILNYLDCIYTQYCVQRMLQYSFFSQLLTR